MKTNLERVVERLEELYLLGKQGDGSHSRVAFTPEDRGGRERFSSYFSALGIYPRVDAAGNLVARLAGKEDDLPAILVGSHLDTVPDGGKYDGALGCVAGLEVCQTLLEAGHRLRHPLEVVVFTDEEGVRFGNGMLGSGAFCGLPQTGLSPTDRDIYGMERGSMLEDFGIRLSALGEAACPRASVHCALELHVEQGSSLHKTGTPIGVVTSIAGVKRYELTVTGEANHAGSTVMGDRKDALVSAARFIAEVPEIVNRCGGPFSVGTVGTIRVSPGSVNVIPGECVFGLEIRDQAQAVMDRMEEVLRERLKALCAQDGTLCDFRRFSAHDPAPMDPRVRQTIAAACEEAGVACAHMPSGAFHDSLLLSAAFPTGMIFIPSVDGISHSPGELSLEADIRTGCDILLQTVLALD